MKLTTDDRVALQGAIRVLVEILQQSPPEVPDTIEQWPADDEYLRGDFWKGHGTKTFGFRDDEWRFWSHSRRQWHELGVSSSVFRNHGPFTRTTDPSAPRTWDTLDDVDTDMERATGDYAGQRRELARSDLSESGWFQRIKGNAPRRWTELPTSETRNVTNIQEES